MTAAATTTTDTARRTARKVWRLLPHDYPAWSTVYDYFRKWRNAGVWEQIVRTLRERVRVQAGRQATPSVCRFCASS